MNDFRHLVLVLVMVLVAPACQILDRTDGMLAGRFQVTKDRYEPVIMTGTHVYTDFEIGTRLENTGDVDLVLTGCTEPQKPLLQKLVDGEWVIVYAAIELLCLGPPVHIRPGEVFEDTLRVSAILDPDLSTEAKWDNGIAVDGRYRLERLVFEDDPTMDYPDTLVEPRSRISQIFEIRPQYNISAHSHPIPSQSPATL